MKIQTCLFCILAFSMFVTSAAAAPDSGSKIAKVNLNRIQSEIHYKKIMQLDMKPEIRKKLRGLDVKIDEYLSEILNTDDEEKLAALKEKIRVVNSKISSIESAINAVKRNRRDYRVVLREYIRNHFSNDYGLIVEDQFLNRRHNIIHINDNYTDITDEVINKLRKDIDK